MTTQLFFVTGNAGKLKEYAGFFERNEASIKIVQKNLDVPEPQSLDLEYIAKEKARAAWPLIQAPFLIDDGGIYLEEYNNFPGPLAKYVFEGIGIDGFLKLALEKPRCSFRTCIVYCDGPKSFQTFVGACMGKIVPLDGATINPALPYRAVFQPDGFDRVLDEIDPAELDEIHHRTKALREFLDWYGAR